MNKTNKELSRDMNCTSRQISKSRKRGWITDEYGERIKYKASEPARFYINSKGKRIKIK